MKARSVPECASPWRFGLVLVYEKLQVRTRTEAVAKFLRR
jgi:hypothetical protein